MVLPKSCHKTKWSRPEMSLQESRVSKICCGKVCLCKPNEWPRPVWGSFQAFCRLPGLFVALWLCGIFQSKRGLRGRPWASPTGLNRRLHKKYGRMSTQEVPEWTHTLLLPLASFCSEAGRQWVGPPLLKLTFWTFWTFWTFTSPNEPLCAFFGLGHHRPFLKLSCEASQKFPAPHQQLGSTQKKTCPIFWSSAESGWQTLADSDNQQPCAFVRKMRWAQAATVIRDHMACRHSLFFSKHFFSQ